MALDLYKPNEYPVVAGNPSSHVALCTLWQDPRTVPAAAYECFALVGSLRSAFGVNVLLYNLARNPWLTELVVWGPDKLSNTNIGLVGKRTLLDLWQNGFDGDGKIAGNGYALLPEVDRAVVATIIRNVRVSDVSASKSLPEAPGAGEPAPAYMEPTYFPEFKVGAPRVWPSEGLGVSVRRRTGAEAFLQLVDRVWKYGAENPIDTGGEAVRELRNPVVVVEAEDYDAIDIPDWLTAIPELGISRAALESYARSQFAPDAYLKEIFPGVRKFERAAPGSYLYAELLYAFPRPAEVDSAVRVLHETAGYAAAVRYLLANARVDEARARAVVAEVDASGLSESERLAVLLEAIIPPTNQVANIADRIRRKPDDLDKEAVLWDPRYHSLLESGRPCLMKLSFSVREGKLDVLAFFRSHDVFGAWFYNYYGIATLLRGLAKSTDVTPGRIVVESESAHLYPRHWPTIERLLKAERVDKPPRMYFEVEEDTDPRGNVIITLDDGKIDLKLLAPGGAGVILELQASSAHELLYRLKAVDPFSRLDHAAFVGSELARAEVALRLGIPYVQEKPLALRKAEA